MSRLTRLVDLMLGGPRSRAFCEVMARVALHGLGVGLPPFMETSGELFFLREFVRKCGCQAAVDVGAHVGDYTACLLNLGIKRILAFEPMPQSQVVFEQRFSGDARVHLHKAALGESAGETTLNFPVDDPTSTVASRNLGAARLGVRRFASVKVVMMTLDDVLLDLGLSPDFLKVDVEGFETEVLAGAKQTIASGCLKAMQLEFGFYNQSRRTSLIDFEALLQGYVLFRLATRSLRPVASDHYLGTIYGYCNLIALRTDIAHDLRRLV